MLVLVVCFRVCIFTTSDKTYQHLECILVSFVCKITVFPLTEAPGLY